MGNLPLPGLFQANATVSKPDGGERFITRRIRNGITYYYTPFSEAERPTVRPATDSSPPGPIPSPSALSLSDPPCEYPSPSPSPRPLLLLLPWLGAQPGAVAKYRDLYLDRGLDVLQVQSSVLHFLWPRWGLDYGLEVLKILAQPPFTGRPVLVHATSIGGFTFTQILTHIAQAPKEHAGLSQRVIGHIYDSLVAGTLEHMAIGLGKTLVPRFESFVKNTAMLYFWLFKPHTADLYERGLCVFQNCPLTSPALFFFSENDALCSPVVLEKLTDHWRRRGVAVASRKWKVSTHAAHMRCHPQEYLSALDTFLKSLHISTLKSTM